MGAAAWDSTAWAVLFTVQLAYCIWHVVAKLALLDGLHPLALALYRELGACVLMHALARRVDGPLRKHVKRADFGVFVLLGFFSFGNIVGFIWALNYITAFNSSLLHPTIPVFAAVLGRLAGVETFSSTKACGVLLCAVGSLVVTLWGVQQDTTKGASNPTLGNVILVGQCLSMAALLVTQKRVLVRVPPTTTTATYYTVATLLTALASVGALWGRPKALAVTTPTAWTAVVFGAVVGVTFVYLALAWATQRTSPTTVAVSMTLQPPVNAILSVMFMGRTSFSSGELLGGSLVSLGLVVTATAAKAPPPALPPMPPSPTSLPAALPLDEEDAVGLDGPLGMAEAEVDAHLGMEMVERWSGRTDAGGGETTLSALHGHELADDRSLNRGAPVLEEEPTEDEYGSDDQLIR